MKMHAKIYITYVYSAWKLVMTNYKGPTKLVLVIRHSYYESLLATRTLLQLTK